MSPTERPIFVETEGTPQQERKKAKIDQLLERRFVIASQSYDLEQGLHEIAESIDEKDIDQTSEQLVAETFTSLSERHRDLFVNYVRAFLNQVIKAKKAEAKLQKNYKLKNAKEHPEAELLGEYVFEQAVKEKPKGKIAMERRGPYFVVQFEKESDFKKMLREEDNAGGSYHSSYWLTNFKTLPSVLLISPKAHQEGTIRHEEQHFRNDVFFEKFIAIEPGKKGYLVNKAERRKRGIKNELLAAMIDSPSIDLEHHINDPLYAHFFNDNESRLFGIYRKNFTDEERKEAWQLIREISLGFEALKTYLKTPKDKQVLVNQLVDIRLEEFPKWLRNLQKFYWTKDDLPKNIEKVKYQINNFNFRYSERVWGNYTIQQTAKYAPEPYNLYAAEIDVLRQKIIDTAQIPPSAEISDGEKTMEETRKELARLTEILGKLLKLQEEIDEKYSLLYPQNISIPLITVAKLDGWYLYSSKDDESDPEAKKKIDDIAKTFVKNLLTFDQEVIDQSYLENSSDSDKFDSPNTDSLVKSIEAILSGKDLEKIKVSLESHMGFGDSNLRANISFSISGAKDHPNAHITIDIGISMKAKGYKNSE